MPNIRILNWNIEKLSGNKAAIPGMANNIGRVIAATQADIAILLEVTSGTGRAAMAAVSAQANAASVANGGAPTDYTGWLVSYSTGLEYYGVLIKNLNLVRPIVVNGPAGADTNASPALTDLDQNQFITWPGTFLAMVNAYAAAPPAAQLPLVDVYSSEPPRGRKRSRFAGRKLGAGGFAPGNGFRMPCLAMFQILNGAGAPSYVVPILICHLGAVRGGANPLARDQVRQYKDINISQKFQNPAALGLPNGSYIDLNNAPQSIQNLIITGDFNIDFLRNAPAGTRRQVRNRAALNSITPTVALGGSAAPAAAPGPAGAVPAVVPFPVPLGGWPEGPVHNTIPNLQLKAAATTQGTILWHYRAGVVPPNLAALRHRLFDNFFFGGASLGGPPPPLGYWQMLTPPADACEVFDTPSQIVQAGVGVGGVVVTPLDVSGAVGYHLAPPGVPPPAVPRHNVGVVAGTLGAGAPATVLSTNDQLIGARLISDHLPTIIQFNLP